MKHSNGTIVIYPINDLLRGRMFAVALKGLDGSVEQFGPFAAISASTCTARGLSAKYGFPVTVIERSPTSYWVAKGVDAGRGQYEIVAASYMEACNIAEVAGLGSFPVTARRFASFPVIGVLEA